MLTYCEREVIFNTYSPLLSPVTDLADQLAQADDALAELEGQLSEKAREISALAEASKKFERDMELAVRQKADLEKQLVETGNSLKLLESLSQTNFASQVHRFTHNTSTI